MLNFMSMAHRFTQFILLSIFWLFSQIIPEYIDTPMIKTPKAGDIIQGNVAITGSTDLAGFKSYDLYFAYAIDATDTLFLINQSHQTVVGGLLGTWDTTTITDGNYRLLLRVYLDDFTSRDTFVTGIKVRNYSEDEKEPDTVSTKMIDSGESQETQPNTADTTIDQSLSKPVTQSSNRLLKSLGFGILISFIILILIGGLILYRTLSRHK